MLQWTKQYRYSLNYSLSNSSQTILDPLGHHRNLIPKAMATVNHWQRLVLEYLSFTLGWWPWLICETCDTNKMGLGEPFATLTDKWLSDNKRCEGLKMFRQWTSDGRPIRLTHPTGWWDDLSGRITMGVSMGKFHIVISTETLSAKVPTAPNSNSFVVCFDKV